MNERQIANRGQSLFRQRCGVPVCALRGTQDPVPFVKRRARGAAETASKITRPESPPIFGPRRRCNGLDRSTPNRRQHAGGLLSGDERPDAPAPLSYARPKTRRWPHLDSDSTIARADTESRRPCRPVGAIDQESESLPATSSSSGGHDVMPVHVEQAPSAFAGTSAGTRSQLAAG